MVASAVAAKVNPLYQGKDYAAGSMLLFFGVLLLVQVLFGQLPARVLAWRDYWSGGVPQRSDPEGGGGLFSVPDGGGGGGGGGSAS